MDSTAFRKFGKEMVDFVADYWDSMRDRQPLPNVQPGYAAKMLPDEAPKKPESWSAIFSDIDPIVLHGNTHWHHPHFFAYYPTACSYPAIMADILSGGIACIGFSWKSSPACSELEQVMLDWLAKALGLPDYFLNSHPGPGAGIIQATASDATFVALLAARSRALVLNGEEEGDDGRVILNNDDLHGRNSKLSSRLVAYCSDQAHSSVEKDALLAGVRLRKLPAVRYGPLENYSLTGEVLEEAITADRAMGLLPFAVIATIGTTPTCGVDCIADIGAICQRERLWLHIDAAYAGSAMICPEYRYLSDGIEFADSFNMNCHKALLMNFDCSPMWFKDAKEATAYFNVDPLYLQHEHQHLTADHRHLQIALGRRFRSLKIWFVMRAYGISGLQEHFRKYVQLQQEFTQLISADPRFELFVPAHLGLTCFRLKGVNSVNERLLRSINEDRRIHLVPAEVHGTYFLRFAICTPNTTSEDIVFAYKAIVELAKKQLEGIPNGYHNHADTV